MLLTSPFVIELTEAERRGLGQADGMSNAAAARAAGRHVDTVRAWRKRFAAERLAALTDRPRPLGRPRLAPEDKLRIIAAATQTPPGADTAWTHRLLADPPGRPGVLHQGRRGVRALPDLPGQRGGVQRG